MANAIQALSTLGDPTRRTIFERIAERPRAVGELAKGLPVSRPAVSQHLHVLEDAALVTVRREGTKRWYRARPEGLQELRAWLEGMWGDALLDLKDAAEKAERRKKR